MSTSPSPLPSPTNTTMLSITPQEVQIQHQHQLHHHQLQYQHHYQPHHQPHHQPRHQVFYPSPPSHHQHRPMPHRQVEPSLISMAKTAGSSNGSPPTQAPLKMSQRDADVTQALDIARESPDGAQDPTVSKILEHALAEIWDKVEAAPDSYVMTRDEFAVFNFFQHRFNGSSAAVNARKRFWDNLHA